MAEGAAKDVFGSCRFAFVCSRTLLPKTIAELSRTVQKYGGEALEPEPNGSLPLADATHIIANSIDFEQYNTAIEMMIPVVTSSWITYSLQRTRQAQIRPYSPDPRMIFASVSITCADIPQGDKEAITGATLALGGMESKDVTRLTTHICALSMDHAKCREAVANPKLRCQIVLPHWFDDCFKLGKKIDETPYLLPDPPILRGGNVASASGTGTGGGGTGDDDDKIPIPDALALQGATTAEPDALPAIDHKGARSNLTVFQNKKIILADDLVIGQRFRAVVVDLITRGGGRVLPAADDDNEKAAPDVADCDMYICRYRDGLDYVRASQLRKDVGNLAWLFHIITNNEWCSPLRRLLHYPVPRDGIPGFSDFTITLSNYGGEARPYLENLVVAAGARFTKTMRMENTHLITARDNSEKCQAAHDWNIPMVNHLWIEESYARCAVQSVTNPRYTTFPPRTNLGEVIGQTFFDEAKLRAMYFAGEPAEASGAAADEASGAADEASGASEAKADEAMADEADADADEAMADDADEADEASKVSKPAAKTKAKTATTRAKTTTTAKPTKTTATATKTAETNNQPDAAATLDDVDDESTSSEAEADPIAAGPSSTLARRPSRNATANANANANANASCKPPAKPSVATPAKRRRNGKENDGPLAAAPASASASANASPVVVGSASRSAKDKALSKLHGLAPDIALYEKERKRSIRDSNAPWGGKRAAEQMDRARQKAADASEATRRKRRSPVDGDDDDSETNSDGDATETRPVKKSRPSLPPIQMRVVLTGYHRWVNSSSKEETERRKLRSLGIQIVQDNQPCDYLAAPCLVRTMKFLKTLARGPQVINAQYISDVLDKGRLLDAADYTLQDTEGEARFAVSLPKALARARANRGRLLWNVVVYCAADIKNGPESYREIAEANGAIFKTYRLHSGTTIRPVAAGAGAGAGDDEASQVPEPVYLLTSASPSERPLWPRFEQMARDGNMQPRIVAPDWLLDVAMRQEVLFDEHYLAENFWAGT